MRFDLVNFRKEKADVSLAPDFSFPIFKYKSVNAKRVQLPQTVTGMEKSLGCSEVEWRPPRHQILTGSKEGGAPYIFN